MEGRYKDKRLEGRSLSSNVGRCKCRCRLTGALVEINCLKTVALKNLYPQLSSAWLLEYFKFHFGENFSRTVLQWFWHVRTEEILTEFAILAELRCTQTTSFHFWNLRIYRDERILSFFIVNLANVINTSFLPIECINKFQSIFSKIGLSPSVSTLQVPVVKKESSDEITNPFFCFFECYKM